MADEPMANKSRPQPLPKKEYENVEFLECSMSDPKNLLRIKLRDLDELPEEYIARRVVVITELVSKDGREVTFDWSEGDGEPSYVVHDSLVALVSRVLSAISSAD